MQPLVKTGRQHPLGRDDVERLETGDAGQQIEVGLVETLRVGNPVGDGDDDVADRIGGRIGDQALAQRVLVASARFTHATLVVAKRVGEKSRLDPHPLRRAIPSVRTQCLLDQLLEALDLLRLAAELIVEAKHLGNQPGSQAERQLVAARHRGVRRRLRHHLPLERAEPARRVGEPGVQAVVHLFAGDDVGVDRAFQQSSRAARRDDDQRSFGVRAVRCGVRSWFGVLGTTNGEALDCAPKRLQFWDSNEPGLTRCNHLS